MPSLSNMKKSKFGKIMFAMALGATLFSCSDNALKGVSLDTAKSLLALAKENQSNFEVKSTKYSFSSTIQESVMDGWISRVTRVSSLKVAYEAPYLISDEKTAFKLTYELTVNSFYNEEENTHRRVTVAKENNVYVVKENEEEHMYAPANDSFVSNFMNLPSLINSNNIASLDIAEQFMSSIGKPNSLTSFEALSSGKDDFVLTFTGDSLSVNNLYDEDPNMPNDVAIESLSLKSTNKRVDSYESKYACQNKTVQIDGRELPVSGTIKVGFTYEA